MTTESKHERQTDMRDACRGLKNNGAGLCELVLQTNRKENRQDSTVWRARSRMLVAIGILRFSRPFVAIAMIFALLINPAAADFAVLDGTGCDLPPQLQQLGVRKAAVLYEWRMWRNGRDRSGLPDEEAVRSIVASQSAEYVVIDIEFWDSMNLPTQELMARYLKVFSWADQARTSASTKIGFYGVVPVRDYWRAIGGGIGAAAWKAENSLRASLASEVDVLFPSAYTFYPDVPQWEQFAERQIEEARRLSKGKRVVLFLWPRYHESNKNLSGDYIGDVFFERQLQVAQRLADGVVVWDKSDKSSCELQSTWRAALARFLATRP